MRPSDVQQRYSARLRGRQSRAGRSLLCPPYLHHEGQDSTGSLTTQSELGLEAVLLPFRPFVRGPLDPVCRDFDDGSPGVDVWSRTRTVSMSSTLPVPLPDRGPSGQWTVIVPFDFPKSVEFWIPRMAWLGGGCG